MVVLSPSGRRVDQVKLSHRALTKQASLDTKIAAFVLSVMLEKLMPHPAGEGLAGD